MKNECDDKVVCYSLLSSYKPLHLNVVIIYTHAHTYTDLWLLYVGLAANIQLNELSIYAFGIALQMKTAKTFYSFGMKITYAHSEPFVIAATKTITNGIELLYVCVKHG